MPATMPVLTAPNTLLHLRKAAEAAKECLAASPYQPLRRILCECDRGVLVLRGRLPSFYYKQLAQEAVARVRGVARVLNEIEVG